MNVETLVPRPIQFETFKRNRLRFIPDRPGCYVLATFGKMVLYVGLAKNLRKRVNDHLDNPEKRPSTGERYLFFG
jgi:excinuclease UvrABC nuclease subunit